MSTHTDPLSRPLSSNGPHNKGNHNNHDHDPHGDDAHAHHDEASHSTFKGYLTGFILSVILTALPFWMVMAQVFKNPNTTTLVILSLASVQIVVHMIYFLHMNTRSQGGWNMLALIFTLVLVVIALTGSLWVMYHLNANMMPTMLEMKNTP